MKYHSTYKGASIFKTEEDSGSRWQAQLEDGMFTYSILEYKANTLRGVKDKINGYYQEIRDLYKPFENKII